MAINFNSFTTGTVGGANPIQSDDYVVGFDQAVPSGERKWPITTLANAISGVMNDELINKINQNSGDGTVTSVTGTAPISVANGTSTPAISIAAATTSAAGSMSSTDKTRLDDASATNGIVKCNGSGDFSAAVAGTDYLTSATLGSSPAAVKAWVNFDGSTTTPTIRSSYNVVSVTRATAGDNSGYYHNAGTYKINFAAGTFVNTNYAVAGISRDGAGALNSPYLVLNQGTSYKATSYIWVDTFGVDWDDNTEVGLFFIS